MAQIKEIKIGNENQQFSNKVFFDTGTTLTYFSPDIY